MGVDNAGIRVDIVKDRRADIAAQRTNDTAVIEPEALLAHPDAATSGRSKGTRGNQTAAEADTLNAVDVRQTDIPHQPCFVLRPDQSAFSDSSAHDDLAGRIKIEITGCVDRRSVIPVRVVLTRRPSHTTRITTSTDQNGMALLSDDHATVIGWGKVCGWG